MQWEPSGGTARHIARHRTARHSTARRAALRAPAPLRVRGPAPPCRGAPPEPAQPRSLRAASSCARRGRPHGRRLRGGHPAAVLSFRPLLRSRAAAGRPAAPPCPLHLFCEALTAAESFKGGSWLSARRCQGSRGSCALL